MSIIHIVQDVFPWHNEEITSKALNLKFDSDTIKFWFFIPVHFKLQFENYIKQNLKLVNDNDWSCLWRSHHKDILIEPVILLLSFKDIPYINYYPQRKGDLINTIEGLYHTGITVGKGFDICSAINTQQFTLKYLCELFNELNLIGKAKSNCLWCLKYKEQIIRNNLAGQKYVIKQLQQLKQMKEIVESLPQIDLNYNINDINYNINQTVKSFAQINLNDNNNNNNYHINQSDYNNNNTDNIQQKCIEIIPTSFINQQLFSLNPKQNIGM